LNAAVCNLTNFIAVEFFPSFTVESFEKVVNVDRVYEVDEGIAHVASVLEIYWQVEEIVMAALVSVYGLKQHFLSVFIWNVFYHY